MKLRITIEGRTYEVDVEVLEDDHAGGRITSTRQAPIPAQRPPARPDTTRPPEQRPTASDTSTKQVKCPIAGLVQRVVVSPGDKVTLNDTLLIIEAMKMETTVASPVAGIVKSVRVDAGEAVRMGDVLVDFE